MNPMRLEPVNPESLGAAKGYSNGVLVRGDCDWLFIAGQIAWDSAQQIVSTQFAAQFEQALKNVATVIHAAGGETAHIVRMTIYVTDKAEYVAALRDVGAAYRAVIGRHYPAMALVQVAALLEPGAKVEIEATAALPRRA